MADLSQSFINTLKTIEENIKNDFEITYDYQYSDKTFPMYCTFTSNQPRSNFIGMKLKGVSKCAEHCFIDTVAYIDDKILEDYFSLCKKLESEVIDSTDKEHEFTFISIVILTNQLPKELKRKLKHFRFDCQYKDKGGYGWSSSRIAVIDFGNKQILTNTMGSSLKVRLKGIKF